MFFYTTDIYFEKQFYYHLLIRNHYAPPLATNFPGCCNFFDQCTVQEVSTYIHTYCILYTTHTYTRTYVHTYIPSIDRSFSHTEFGYGTTETSAETSLRYVTSLSSMHKTPFILQSESVRRAFC